MDPTLAPKKPPKKNVFLALLWLVLALLYGVSPMDVIPDVVPLFGFGDDAVVVAAALYHLWRVIKNRHQPPPGGN